MKIQSKQWVRIENSDQLKIFEDTNTDVQWANGVKELLTSRNCDGWLCNINDSMHYATSESAAASHKYTEYKLPRPFPKGHYFLNTPENIAAFKERFPYVRMVTGNEFGTIASHAEAYGYGYSNKKQDDLGLRSVTHGSIRSYEDKGYERYYFDHESPGCDKDSLVEKFPVHHYFKNTPENIKEFLQRFPGLKSNLGQTVDESWFKDKSYAAEYGVGIINQVSSSCHGWYAENGYQRFEFEHEKKPSNPQQYKAGDKIVVVKDRRSFDGDDAHWTKYSAGTIATVKVVADKGDVTVATPFDAQQGLSQILRPSQIRPATKQDEVISAASKSLDSYVKKIENDFFASCYGKLSLSESAGSITFATPTGLGKGGSQPIGVAMHATESIPAGTLVSLVPTSTPKKEEKMLTKSEQEEVIRLAVEAATKASSGSSGQGVASKATGLATSAAKDLIGWAVAPAKPVGRIAMKLLQYGVFLVGIVGGGSYLAYWTYNNGKSYLPTIEFKKPAEESPSDKAASVVTHFATTGEIPG